MSRTNGRPELEVIANVRLLFYFIAFFANIYRVLEYHAERMLISPLLQFIDGFSYSKGKLEEAFRPGGFLEKAPPKPHKEALPSFVKKEDVEIIVRSLIPSRLMRAYLLTQIHEFEIPRQKAEKILVDHEGDIEKALRVLIKPQ